MSESEDYDRYCGEFERPDPELTFCICADRDAATRANERLRIAAELDRLANLCPDPYSNDAQIIRGCAAAVRGMK